MQVRKTNAVTDAPSRVDDRGEDAAVGYDCRKVCEKVAGGC